MIQTERLRLVLDNYRAVRHAEISIGDLTVLSGVNACGKSTIAHVVHSLVNLSRDYALLAEERALKHVRTLMRGLGRVYGRLVSNDGEGHRYFSVFTFRRKMDATDGFEEKRRFALSTITKVMDKCEEMMSSDSLLVEKMLRVFLVDVDATEDLDVSIPSIRQWLEDQIGESERMLDEFMARRTRIVWSQAAEKATRWVSYPGSVMLSEGDSCVCRFGGDGEPCLNEILGIEHAFYIESPWCNAPGVALDGSITIGDGFALNEVYRDFSPDQSLFSALEGEVWAAEEDEELDSSSSSGEAHSEWMYARSDGHAPFPLDECATGIKSLSLLNFLYTRGCLGRKTLLIVDEPEAHLHPQWIVEYAKILIKLNRNLGVRLLITTHSPDMLNALRRMANVEEVPDVIFYLAEEVSPAEKYDFNYRNLGRQVEDIFRKFNLAADRVEAYPEDGH